LLPAIGGRFGSEGWTTGELFDEPDLRALLQPLTAKQAGRLFSRSLGLSIDSMTLERMTTEHGAAVWRVVSIN
jgi:hypothetical protein